MRISKLNPFQRHLILIIDEIYTAKRVEYSSSEGKIFGISEPNSVCGTILGFMISAIGGSI